MTSTGADSVCPSIPPGCDRYLTTSSREADSEIPCSLAGLISMPVSWFDLQSVTR